MQRSKEWFESRRGKFTASEIHKLMGVKGFGQTGETYIYSKAAEMLCDDFQEISSTEMRWGTDYEPFAKELFSKSQKLEIIEADFLPMPCYEDFAGASPDGLIFENGTLSYGIEIKCPYTAVNHLKYALLRNGDDLKNEKPEYYWQTQMNMLCAGVNRWLFISFHPFFKLGKQMFITEIKKNDFDCELLTARICKAMDMQKEILKRIG